MELNLQEQPKKKPKLDVPVAVYRIIKLPPNKGVTKTSRNFPCTMCNKSFKRGFDLKRHMNLHTGERIYKCEVCEKIFLDSSNLSEHLRIHSGVKPWRCKFCNRYYRTLSNLRVHITVHNKEGRPYDCKNCKKRFPDHSSYQKHKCIHAGRKLYVCGVCQKTFVHNGELNIHRKIHAKVKPFNCQHCGKGFTKRSNYTRHLLIHEGDKVFSCTVCGVNYSVEISLRLHLRTHGLFGNKVAMEQKALLDDNNSDELFERDALEETADDPSEKSKKLATTNMIEITSTNMKHISKMKKLPKLQKRVQPVKLDNPIPIEADTPQPITNAEVYETTEPQTEIEKLDTIQAEKDPTVLSLPDESTNMIRVTSTDMKHISKMKKLPKFQKRLRPVKLDNPIPIEAEAPQLITNAEVYEMTEPQTEKIDTIQAEKDPTVLPPPDESISREKTTEDVTSLLNCEDFGSTKDIPQALLSPRLKSLDDVLSSQLLSFLSNMCKSEHICSTNEASDLLSEVLNSLNSGNVNSSNESVITIISIS